jgi:hypothetical protein
MKKTMYVGLFLVALATLLLEILLTRIFSVTMYYHFAFLAISVAMFGMTVGALLVYFFPGYFPQNKIPQRLSISALLFSISIVVSFIAQLLLPALFLNPNAGILGSTQTYLIVTLPFIFSGVCICLALTKFPQHVGKLYAADLVGAASGCLAVIFILKFSDGPSAVILTAGIAAMAAVAFSFGISHKWIRSVALVTVLLWATVALSNAILAQQQRPFLRISWTKGKYQGKPLYEKWNSFSRIAVWDYMGLAVKLFPNATKEYWLDIDAAASTMITEFKGDVTALNRFRSDILNLAHFIRRQADVLVIGVGGGRDVLSALLFQQKSVLGIEMNEDIVSALNGRFGDFSGHLDKNPKVRFVVDEARSYISRTNEKFDIIQASFIDTWAATAAGAMVLTESSLYTVEAWKTFLEHLNPRGILTFSRWYYPQMPAEVYRLTALAAAALREIGVQNPRDHIIIVRRPCLKGSCWGDDTGTILVSRDPFSAEDIALLRFIAEKTKWDIVLHPQDAINTTFAALASGVDPEQLVPRLALNVRAPTDDSPFFFYQLRPGDIFNRAMQDQSTTRLNLRAVSVLLSLLITVILLSLLCIIVPLMLTNKQVSLEGSGPFFLFFASIGFGFMLIEISQMQRLNLFLGHPVYGLSVVLFSLLLFGGLGSYVTERLDQSILNKPLFLPSLSLLGVLVLFGLSTNGILDHFRASSTPLRIGAALFILAPLGFFMGMQFPQGMKIAARQVSSLTPWLWGINGAASVCASVLAIVIALLWGISASFWIGFGCYLLSFFMILWVRRTAG